MGILHLLGYLLAIVGGLWLLVVAFRTSILWGLACFIPFGGLIFALLHLEESKAPFLTALAGVAIMFLTR
ncbi:MAG TPA: hypothetical protein VGM86_14025 [Thermoanaerobaculia bacterium]|jgi:hypothetical protein